MHKKTVALIIMDGFGNRAEKEGNAVLVSGIPNLTKLKLEYPTTELRASGREVGLPSGQMGNSEVGHLNLGAGRIVYQDITKIDKLIEDGEFFKNKTLEEAMNNCIRNKSTLHLMGLLSNGGVHSTIEHLYALLKMAKQKNVQRVIVHCFMDGRDTPPNSGINFIKALKSHMSSIGIGKIGTIMGRYYIMDRDKRYERLELGYNALMNGVFAVDKKLKLTDLKISHNMIGAEDAVKQSYEKGITDEFIVPTVIENYKGMDENDSVIFYNFRADRAREISTVYCDNKFNEFITSKKKIFFVGFTQYDEKLIGKIHTAFEIRELKNTLGEYLGDQGITQVRIAETEKYAHVTFFFSGGIETPFINEERILVPSPKVATYDMQPKMSAYEVCEKTINSIGKYDVIIVNFANCDMVGHTGVMDATVRAVKVVDECVQKVINKILEVGGQAIITADHGNAEQMIYPDGSICTTHTTNPVPCILVSEEYKKSKLKQGKALQDIAPTLLQLLKLKQPKEMTGESLIL